MNKRSREEIKSIVVSETVGYSFVQSEVAFILHSVAVRYRKGTETRQKVCHGAVQKSSRVRMPTLLRMVL